MPLVEVKLSPGSLDLGRMNGRARDAQDSCEDEKGSRDRLYPAAPELAEMLLAADDRTGFAFNLAPRRVLKHRRPTDDTVCRTLSLIGQSAGIVVDRKGDDVIYATAHDLRSSFGLRWAQRVMPAVLMEMMRHESIETTMKYYAVAQAEDTAAAIYAVVGNTRGNTNPDSPAEAESGIDVTRYQS